MSGILDKKSRILDAILTVEGRRQMAEGTYNVSYVTFTDSGVSYIPDSEEGHEDPTDKIYFEACNLPQDQIVFEANDNGKLISRFPIDVKVDYGPFSHLSSSVDLKSSGILENGRLSVFGYTSGRSIKVVKGFENVDSDAGKGFVYGDSLGVTASIVLDPLGSTGGGTDNFGVYIDSPFKGRIGTKRSIPSETFALKIAKAVTLLSQSGGPNVSAYSVGDMVFLDNNMSTNNLIFEITGSNLSSPLLLKNSSIGSTLLKEELENAYFSSAIRGILTSSFDNFIDLQTISSINRLFEDDQFETSISELNFDAKTSLPPSVKTSAYNSSIPELNAIDSLFSDEKVSHLDNYLYLPPIVKTSDAEVPDKSDLQSLNNYLLGDYPSWGNNETKLTYQKLATHLSQYVNSKSSLTFTKTSLNNNIVAQFFEVTNGDVSKLDVIEYGHVMDNSQESTSTTKNVFFVGKTFIDDRGTLCFVNMFTLVFERDDSPEAFR